MNARHISGLAIVNSSGVIVGNTSASDLKLFIAKPSFRLLRMAVFQYLVILLPMMLCYASYGCVIHALNGVLYRILFVDQ
jgi:hypothetical protein